MSPWRARWTSPRCRSCAARSNRVIAPPRQEVVVDLAAVEFIDASGIGARVGAAAAAARAGVRFRLQAPSPPVERVLELARVDGGLVPGL